MDYEASNKDAAAKDVWLRVKQLPVVDLILHQHY